MTVLIAIASFVLYIVAYRTYGRFLARRIFRVEPDRVPPSVELEDGVDYVPSKRSIVFGHHFTSIAGTGPIVGPAVAVVWGWVPALIWVLVGSIFMGAVHDFGSLIVSMRHKGRTIADLAGDVVNPRVRLLFLLVVVVGLWIVLAIFGLVIATVFELYPSSVVPVFLQIPIAVGLGIWLKRGGNVALGTVVAVFLMYATIVWSSGIDWQTAANLDGVAIIPAAVTQVMSPVAFWTLVLLVYVFIASVLPVQTLLQPRDFINSWQLLIAMGLLLAGLLYSHPPIVADAVNMRPADSARGGAPAPPFIPFLFVTIACGAISGFHCLVASGCSSRQLTTEADAQYVGYGAMLTEGFLAILVILACCAGIGLGTDYPHAFTHMPAFMLENGLSPELVRTNVADEPGNASFTLFGEYAWRNHYATWGGSGGLGDKLAPFIRGSANMIETLGLPFKLAISIMGVFVASFAATTLDSACRLQRYVITELAGGGVLDGESCCAQCGYSTKGLVGRICPECGSDRRSIRPRTPTNIVGRMCSNRFVATSIAVLTAGVLALSDGILETEYWQGPGTAVQFGTAHTLMFTLELAEGEQASRREYSFFVLRGNRSDDPAATRNSAITTKTRLELDLTRAGKGGLILWPVFGATNQLLGGLALLVVTVWLVKKGRPPWVTAIPMVFMLAMTGWAIALLIKGFAGTTPHLFYISILMLALEVWIVIEAGVLLVRRAKT